MTGSEMTGSMKALLLGTLTLRTATGTTGALLIVWNKHLHQSGAVSITPVDLATITLAFYVTELLGSPIFGIIADRIGRKPVMLLGPLFGLAAVTLTPFAMTIPLLICTRLLEGSSTAASVPSILSFVAAKTSHDAKLRGRVVTLFEVATLGGLLVAGTALAGPLWDFFAVGAFAVNGGIYLLSLALFAYGVKDEHAAPPQQTENRLRKYLKLFSQRGILLFVPTWVSINAIIGVWVPQGLNLLLGDSGVESRGQFLMSGFPFTVITSAFAFVALIGGVGLFFWGNRFANFRRTTMLLLGLIAFVVAMAAVFSMNRLSGADLPLIALLFTLLCGSMFFIAGATPAALGFLADVSERYHTDRSAVMGLYSIFLGLGQVIGVKIAGDLATSYGVDGLVYATLGFLVVAGTFLLILRRVEHEILLPSAPGQHGVHG
ncbi:MAG: MFS transporter [Chloroflexi bacterium]|nr:MFS transporter [Chloroflexota bacterium]